MARYIPGKPLGPATVRSAARDAWGQPDTCRQVVPGVWGVSTPGHGGFLVAVGPNEPFQLDESLRRPGFVGREYSLNGWTVLTWYLFEEDTDWSLLFEAHPELLAPAIRKGIIADGVTIAEVRTSAESNRQWQRDEAARKAAIAEHPERYVWSASGDWKDGVPKGYVEVTTHARTTLYVPKDEYRAHNTRQPIPDHWGAL